jgi:pimeloyl-ACP methyl ester carboxylesterase
MNIDSLEAVQLGDTTQWIRVRAEDPSNPVLLLIQQGPGLPMINEVRGFEATLGLEKDFIVVYWDQRGCGRSLKGPKGNEGISLQSMVEDTVALMVVLNDRFNSELFVAGFSLGATVGALACAKRPDLVTALIATGVDVDGVAAAHSAYEFALATARQRGNKRAVRQLTKIGEPPHVNVGQFGTRVRWASNFGGVTANKSYAGIARSLIASLMRSSDYSLGDVVRTLRGITATQGALLPEINQLYLDSLLPRLDTPIVFVQGRLDMVAPAGAAERYFNALESPSKQLVWFENSAHTPHLDEPQAFLDLLRQIRDGERATVEFEESDIESGGPA